MKRYTASVMETSMLDVYALTYLQNKPKILHESIIVKSGEKLSCQVILF